MITTLTERHRRRASRAHLLLGRFVANEPAEQEVRS